MNLKRLLYFSDLLCKKIDLHADAFVERIEALRRGDSEKVEFIEMMMLKPLDKQIIYLADKLNQLVNQDKNDRRNQAKEVNRRNTKTPCGDGAGSP